MFRHTLRPVYPYAVALVLIASTSAVLRPFRTYLDPLSVGLLYLVVVSVLSLWIRTGPSVVASVAAFLCFDYFFIPPYGTMDVARLNHVLALLMFLGIDILITQLVVRARIRTAEALRRERHTATLYDLSTTLISGIGLDDTLDAIAQRVRQVFTLTTCAIALADDLGLSLRAVAGAPLDMADPNLLGAARWVMEKRRMAGIARTRVKLRPPGPHGGATHWNFAEGRRGRDLLLLPITTTDRALGVLIVARARGGPRFDDEEGKLLETFANQAALAIERLLLAEQRTRAEILARSDALKSALLSAVSHDLRTPLASIKASVTSLLQPDVEWSVADRDDLLSAINEEADRLNRLVANLLDLSRIEAGALQPDFGWYELSEVVYAAVDRCEPLLRGHNLAIELAEAIPTLRYDFVEIVQVLFNLIENAATYSPAHSPITLSAYLLADTVETVVRDEGVGIPRGEEERVFDKFYRIEAKRRPQGAGLGLAICKGFVEAHGGRIWAERNAGKGSTFHFTLPLAKEAPPAELVPALAEGRGGH